uniref:NELL2-interacting cell ontogeny regulator 1 n=1 Tax=Chrysemys picta bellii TaxID=8478 RepID=A0A8C3IM10_CHRPI
MIIMASPSVWRAMWMAIQLISVVGLLSVKLVGASQESGSVIPAESRPCVDCHAFEFMQRALQDLKKTAYNLDTRQFFVGFLFDCQSPLSNGCYQDSSRRWKVERDSIAALTKGNGSTKEEEKLTWCHICTHHWCQLTINQLKQLTWVQKHSDCFADGMVRYNL